MLFRSARRKLKCVINEQCRQASSAGLRAVAVTLTYRNPAAFASKHISGYLDRVRRILKRQGCGLPYLWVLERATTLHYHLLLWLPRTYKLDPKWISKCWLWGSTWVDGCRSARAWGRYIAKCGGVAALPKGARIYGYGGLDNAGKTAVSRAALPRWILPLLPASHRARRCPGGGWVDCTTGEVFQSPYRWTPWGAVLAIVSPPTCH